MNKTIITRNFSRYAHLYDEYSGVQSKAAKELLGLIKQEGFECILEIGCGTGNYTSLLRERFKDARIKSVDISEKMLEVAKGKLKDRGIEFITGDSEELKFDGAFDLITSNACFQWFDDLQKALASLRKSLSHQGLISFSIFGPLTLWELNSSLKSALGDLSFTADKFISQDNLKALLTKNFKGSEIKEVQYEELFTDLNSLLHKIKYTGVRGNGLADKFSFNRGILEKVENIYLEKFGGIKATFQVFFCQGQG